MDCRSGVGTDHGRAVYSMYRHHAHHPYTY